MSNNNKVTASVLGLTCALSGCQAYSERHDGVTNFAGDAQAINEVKMVSDPWKKKAYNDHLHGDGERLGDVVKRYKTAHGEESGNSIQPLILPTMQGPETN